MGMGVAPCQTVTVTTEALKQVVPNEYKRFADICIQAEIDLETVCYIEEIYALRDGEEFECENDVTSKDVVKVYEALCEAFSTTGLSLNINHINEDEGGRYDDVEGLFWEVSGVYQLTPEAKAFKEKFGNESIKDVAYTIWC